MEDSTNEVTTTSERTRDRLAKLLIGSAIGFIATAMAENFYDKVVASRRVAKIDETNE